MPGLIYSLEFFKSKGMKIALASSGTEEYIQIVLDKFSIRNYFNVIVSGNDVKKGKPDPETYAIAVKKLNLKPVECVVLEDATVGIIAAKAAGCMCIAVKNNYTLEQDLSKADTQINSLQMINDILLSKID